MQTEFQSVTQAKDYIQLEGIQKIKGLEVEDKYKVLEFLVKEMMNMRDEMPPKQKYSYRSDHYS